MDVAERHVGDAVVLDLTGQLTLGESSARLKDKINSLLHQGARQLFINQQYSHARLVRWPRR